MFNFMKKRKDEAELWKIAKVGAEPMVLEFFGKHLIAYQWFIGSMSIDTDV